MANSLLENLPEIVSPSSGDLIYITNSADSNASSKIRYSNLIPSLSSFVTLTGVQVLTNKDLTSGTNTFPTTIATLTGTQSLTNKTFGDPITFSQVATPANPTANNDKLYFKSDDKLYKLTSGGVETEIGSGGTVNITTSTLTNITGLLGGNGANVISVPYNATPTANNIPVLDSNALLPQIAINKNNAIAASGNAATVPITYRLNTVTNNSAATLTITMTTTSAVDGQISEVRILDSSAAAQTIAWVNTENSTVLAPTTSNGSTTLPLIVGFQYNAATSLWRCIASA